MRKLLLVVLCPVTGLTLAGCPGGDDGGGQCATILPGELVITEIFADHDAPSGSSGADEGKEWFEVYNASSGAIDLEGLTITHSRPDGSSDHVHVMGAATIPAGDYFVLGNVGAEFVDGFLDYGYGADLGDLFNTDGGMFTISCGADEIDHALYDEVVAGKSTGFDGGATPDYTANDDLVNWCTPPEEPAYEFEQTNFGTPGQGNFDCEVVVAGQCNDNGSMRSTEPPMPGDLVITEVHPNPSGTDDKQEFVEALVKRDIDLNGVGIGKASDTTPSIVTSEDCLRVTTGTYIIFGKSTVTDAASPDYNGGLPRVDGLFDATMADAGDIQISMGTTILDAFAWANAPASSSYNLDPDFMDPASNDMERYWCASSTPWVPGPPPGDEGSPGAANEECTILPGAGMCYEPAGSTTPRAIVSPTAGQLAITEVMPTPTTPQGDKEWIEVRASGAFDLNGLKLKRIGTTTGTSSVVSADCLHVEAGDYALFAKNTDSGMNGGLAIVDGTFTFSMVAPCLDPACGLEITTSTDTSLDVVHWDQNLSCTALDTPLACCTGAGTGTCTSSKVARQLDPDVTDATGNDTLASWCDATSLYNTTDTGTPRMANDVQCP